MALKNLWGRLCPLLGLDRPAFGSTSPWAISGHKESKAICVPVLVRPLSFLCEGWFLPVSTGIAVQSNAPRGGFEWR